MGVWKKTQCNFCALSCGLEMEVENNKIISVRPDPDSPAQRATAAARAERQSILSTTATE